MFIFTTRIKNWEGSIHFTGHKTVPFFRKNPHLQLQPTLGKAIRIYWPNPFAGQ